MAELTLTRSQTGTTPPGLTVARKDTLLRHYSVHQRSTDHQRSTSKTVNPRASSRPSRPEPPQESAAPLLVTTSVVLKEELDTTNLGPSEGSARMKSLRAEHGKKVDCGSVNESTYPLPSTSESLASGIEATAAQSLHTVTANDQFQNIHNDFNPQVVQAGDEISGFALDPPPSFDFEQNGITWENFDTGDLAWCLLGSTPRKSGMSR